MICLNVSEARERLCRLLDETALAHDPVFIVGPRSNGVLVSEDTGMPSRKRCTCCPCPVCESRFAKVSPRQLTSVRRNRSG